MPDKFDYLEPQCALCGGAEFYYPDENAPSGRIPVSRIIEKLDSFLNKNDLVSAQNLLEYWRSESVALRDRQGELSILNELVGLYRKVGNKEKGLDAISSSLEIIKELGQSESVSSGTVLLNCATAYKAFGMAESSIPLYRTAERIYEKNLQPSDSKFGGLYNNMALALVDLRDFSGAEKTYLSALDIMKQAKHGELECAITLINMAHMYEKCLRLEKVDDLMQEAYGLLMTESLPRDGYFAYVCECCEPSFAYFGYDDISAHLKKLYGEIYAGA